MYFLKRTLGLAYDITTTTTAATTTNSVDDVVRPPEQQPEAGSMGATLWSLLSSKLGGDVLMAGISLPSWLYEPLSILQRQAEMVEYGEVLMRASQSTDPVERLAYTAGFAVSGYSATQRYKPDFNPLLGETFEYVDKRCNTRFFAEQVSHHPPISALHVTNDDNWIFFQNSSPTTKFLGNCIDIDTKGNSHVVFPKWGDHYAYTNPQCTRIHNLIFGTMWIEHFGTLSIKSLHDSSLSCTINFKKSGLFQGPQFKVEGFIEDSSGKKLVKLEGRWDESIEGKWLEDTVTVKKGETRTLWVIAHDTFLHDEYNFTQYTKSLNDFDTEMKQVVLPTDSRRRLDRLYLESYQTDIATHWKKIIEDKQRQDRKNRTTAWQPIWFKKDENNGDMWVYSGGYWEERDEKIQLLRRGEADISKLLRPPQVIGLACDFTSYETTNEDATTDQDNAADTATDTATDTTTFTTTDSDHKDDTDTETELEGWSETKVANQQGEEQQEMPQNDVVEQVEVLAEAIEVVV